MRLIAFLTLLAAFLPARAWAAEADYAVPGGRYFTQTGGYGVVDDGDARFWSAFVALGGVGAVGYPASERFVHDGFVTQVMQKAVFQWRPETGQVYFVNVFDDLARAGKNDWLLSVRSTPKPLPPDFDGDRDWPGIVKARQSLLDARPAIRARYFSVADPLLRYGLPTSRIEDMGNHYAVRLQRAVIQEWKVDVPWAKAGETTVANGGDIMKEAGLIPADATEGADPPSAPASAPLTPDVRITSEVVSLRQRPSASSAQVAQFFMNATVEATGPVENGWLPVRAWNALEGWLPVSTTTSDGYPAQDTRPCGRYRRAIPARPVASMPLAINASARVNGAPTRVVAYKNDGGKTRYQLATGEWVAPSAATIAARDPTLLRPVALTGKGMWATYDLLQRASPDVLVQTAKANGLTHIYLEVARSNLGFYGADGLDRLVRAAKPQGITVVAWVYPQLKDTVADVAMTVEAARHADVLAADVEENLNPDEVVAYSQLVRALHGDDYPMVVATYPPDSYNGRTYPFATVARSWNVIAPMDYYHRPEGTYTPDQVYQYVKRSIELVRQRAGANVAVAPIGQAYGMKWPNEMGPTSPSGEETQAMLRAAKDSGALGIGFFEWAHATAPQWREIGAFRWSS